MSELLKYEAARLVDCRELDRVVNLYLEPYGRTWKSLDSGYGDFHNGSYVKTTVYEGVVIEDDEDQSFSRWITGEGPFYLPEDERYACELPGVHHMLQFLCNKGKLAPGTYVVELWW